MQRVNVSAPTICVSLVASQVGHLFICWLAIGMSSWPRTAGAHFGVKKALPGQRGALFWARTCSLLAGSLWADAHSNAQ